MDEPGRRSSGPAPPAAPDRVAAWGPLTSPRSPHLCLTPSSSTSCTVRFPPPRMLLLSLPKSPWISCCWSPSSPSPIRRGSCAARAAPLPSLAAMDLASRRRRKPHIPKLDGLASRLVEVLDMAPICLRGGWMEATGASVCRPTVQGCRARLRGRTGACRHILDKAKAATRSMLVATGRRTSDQRSPRFCD